MKTGIELIAEERDEQIKKHHFTVEEDVQVNDQQQLAIAAMWLIDGSIEKQNYCPAEWDSDIWQRMARKSYRERLIIAGALIAAEIDRIQHMDS